MRLRISCVSDVGCLRGNNEDIASVGTRLIRDGSLDADKEISEDEAFSLLVSDGMGGHESGEYASQFTLEALTDFLFDRSSRHQNPALELKEKVEEISAKLNRKASEQRQDKSMGCTLSGIVWLAEKVLLVNVGDSRTYRLRNGKLTQLTSDQTLHERDKTPFPVGKVLFNCIGANCNTEAYIEETEDLLMDSDRILICSDGLSDMLDDGSMESILAGGSPKESCIALAEAAKKNGGIDNLTAIVADVLQARQDDPKH